MYSTSGFLVLNASCICLLNTLTCILISTLFLLLVSPTATNCNPYKELQLGTVHGVNHRWSKFIARWESALAEGKEVIVMLDANLDFLTWRNSEQ